MEKMSCRKFLTMSKVKALWAMINRSPDRFGKHAIHKLRDLVIWRVYLMLHPCFIKKCILLYVFGIKLITLS